MTRFKSSPHPQTTRPYCRTSLGNHIRVQGQRTLIRCGPQSRSLHATCIYRPMSTSAGIIQIGPCDRTAVRASCAVVTTAPSALEILPISLLDLVDLRFDGSGIVLHPLD